MTSLNISLPETLKKFVEEQTEQCGYSTPSEYVRQLLREDRKRRAEEKLEALLLAGLNTGKPVRSQRRILAEAASTDLRSPSETLEKIN